MPLSLYGTAHEDLEDERNTAVSRRPTAIQDEIVTDEKGRRRFHGAFTGGFSAGYFNTVGSRHGWVPQTFRSSKDERGENQKQTVHDFMDDEIRTKSTFMDQIGGKGEALAWERAGPSTSNNFNDLAMQLKSTFQDVNESIGVKILKSMGWRPGKGIGPRMKRKQLEKLKVTEARQMGQNRRYDADEVEAMEELAPDAEYAPDDIPRLFLKPNEGEHGLGYKPLERTNVLEEDFLFKVDAYKEKLKSKGIRGQAFGVGAFEEDDDDIYAAEDLSKYDFAIGGPETEIREVAKYDSVFVPASHPEKPKFFKAPQPSKHFNPQHRCQPILLKESLPELGKAFSHLNPLQKAVFLGDRSGSVMELLSDEDRKNLKLLTKKTEVEAVIEKKVEKKRVEVVPFEEEPMKAHRFKKFVHYLKSGHEMPAPVEMTLLEWEEELRQFENHLTPELRSMLPSVRDRQQPLAKLTTAQPIADQLKSRFRSENSAKTAETPESSEEQLRKDAVAQKQFGALTRKKYTWYPNPYLCKYFNVEEPYPDSREEGCPELRKARPSRKKDFDLDLLGMPSTEKEMVDRIGKEVESQRKSRWTSDGKQQNTVKDQTYEAHLPTTEKPAFLPPIELLTAVFEQTLASRSPSSSPPSSRSSSVQPIEPEPPKPEPVVEKMPEKFVTVLDLVPDDNEYGPKIPECFPILPPPEPKAQAQPKPAEPEVIQLDSSSDSSHSESSHKRKRRRQSSESPRKHNKKKKHRRKEEKKAKKERKHRKPKHATLH